jgi:hypothetical protein
MPTARELLEQADALMRRNRSAGNADAPASRPSLRPSIPSSATHSPRAIQREPIAPSIARTSLPVDPTESPLIAPEADAPPASQPEATEAEPAVPLLTEAIDEPEAVAADPASAADSSSGDELDDVPLLTDAVEEIDVGTVQEPVGDFAGDTVDEAARGEPSFWLATERGERSVLGRAPDSVAVVPPPDGGAPSGSAGESDPLGLDQPAPGFVPAVSASVEASADVEVAEALSVEARDPDASPEPSDEPGDALQPAIGEATFAAAGDRPEPEPASDASSPMPPAEQATEVSAQADAEVAGFVAEADAPSVATVAAPFDDARIREVAEEIRMQVMQRLDIFTDTTLRSQLGERLKPVVDRASAELVDSINQHVGELLRTYVAEAIEREIANWRDRQGH